MVNKYTDDLLGMQTYICTCDWVHA